MKLSTYFSTLPLHKLLLLGLTCILPLSTLNALELNLGTGEFTINQSIKPLFTHQITLPINTISLSETHQNIGKGKLYYSFNLEYFDSDTLNKVTDFASKPLTSPIPFVGDSISDRVSDYTQLPVPADYRMHGINFDLGLGYEVLKDNKKHVGVGINTGLSLPFMEVHNMKNTANLLMELADRFDTEIKTYKLGASAFAQYQLKPDLSVTLNTSFNLQTGQMDNNIIGSGIELSGTYFSLTSQIYYQPKLLKGFALNAGYTLNQWNYDGATISTPIGGRIIPRMMDTSYSNNNLFLGVGYHF